MSKLTIDSTVLEGLNSVFNFNTLRKSDLDTLNLDLSQLQKKEKAGFKNVDAITINKAEELKNFSFIDATANVRVYLTNLLYLRNESDEPLYKLIKDKGLPISLEVKDVQFSEDKLGNKFYPYYMYQSWSDAIDTIKKSKVTEGEDIKMITLNADDTKVLFSNKEFMKSLHNTPFTESFETLKSDYSEFDDDYARKFTKCEFTFA